MALRLLEIVLPSQGAEELSALLLELEPLQSWRSELADGTLSVRVLMRGERTEGLLDRLEARFGSGSGFRAVLLPVEATVPAVVELATARPAAHPAERLPSRISRQELLADLEGGFHITSVYLLLAVLSAVVAAAGMLRDQVAVVIGAMVIAPLLAPNVALALATTLGDLDLARRALRTNLAGLAVAFALAVAAGVLLPHGVGSVEVLARTQVELGDVALALASGCAGALAFTTGVSASLIGVMVAVALMPPLVAVGLLLGYGHPELALRAALLFATNVICVNLAAVLTFLSQGIHPRTWFESDRARRATHVAVALWSSMLLLLVVVIELVRRSGAAALLASCLLLAACGPSPAHEFGPTPVELVEGAAIDGEGARTLGRTGRPGGDEESFIEVSARRTLDGSLHIEQSTHSPPYRHDLVLTLGLDELGVPCALADAVSSERSGNRWPSYDMRGRVSIDRSVAEVLAGTSSDPLLVEYDLVFGNAGSDCPLAGKILLPEGWRAATEER